MVVLRVLKANTYLVKIHLWINSENAQKLMSPRFSSQSAESPTKKCIQVDSGD